MLPRALRTASHCQLTSPTPLSTSQLLYSKSRQAKSAAISTRRKKSEVINRSTSIVGISNGRIAITGLSMVEDSASSNPASGFDPSAWLNPNTRGGVIVWSIILITIPVGFYNYFVGQGLEEGRVGSYVGAIFVLLSNVLWASTYVFRVANKDMTYAKQLRDYENAVLQKRLEELADDEIDALMQEIELEEKKDKDV